MNMKLASVLCVFAMLSLSVFAATYVSTVTIDDRPVVKIVSGESVAYYLKALNASLSGARIVLDASSAPAAGASSAPAEIPAADLTNNGAVIDYNSVKSISADVTFTNGIKTVAIFFIEDSAVEKSVPPWVKAGSDFNIPRSSGGFYTVLKLGNNTYDIAWTTTLPNSKSSSDYYWYIPSLSKQMVPYCVIQVDSRTNWPDGSSFKFICGPRGSASTAWSTFNKKLGKFTSSVFSKANFAVGNTFSLYYLYYDYPDNLKHNITFTPNSDGSLRFTVRTLSK